MPDELPRNGRRRAPETRRGELLDAAGALFAERGYDGTAVSDIVSRAGVAQGTFYLYFPTKAHCCAALAEQVAEELLALMQRVLDDAPPDGSGIAASIDALGAYYEDHHALLAVLHRHAAPNELKQVHLQARRTATVPLAAAIERACDTGHAAVPDPRLAAWFIAAAVEENLHTAVAFGEPAPLPEVLESSKGLIARLLGLRVAQGQPG